jgi:anti-anti-sigma factor
METFQNQPIIIAIPGTIYPEILEHFQEKLAMQVAAAGAEYVLDMKSVVNVYSTIITLIVSLSKQISALQGRMCIVNASMNVQLVLRNLNIDSIMPIYDSMLAYELLRDTAVTV